MTETVRRSAESVIQIGPTAYPVLTPDSTVGTGLQVMIASGLRSLKGAGQRGASDRPESIHRFRIGLRRLRSVLSAFSSVLPEDERRGLNRRLGSVGRSYSRLREWDVFIADTVQPLAESLPDEPSIVELEATAREARKSALPDTSSLRRQVEDIATTIEEADWLQRPAGAFELSWQKDLNGFASELLAKRHRRLRKRLKKVDIADQEDFHQLRIQAKKIRYPTEMFGNLFDPKAADSYLDRLIAVQDVLGHLNDAFVARDRLIELPISSRAQGLVSGWLAHEVKARRDRFPRAAKQLRKATLFWEI
ncbi:MAG TPA: CHAD domain-containing protein [Stellaceae bacterium]|jgi:CHAD domain-containing protein|nr:CHAD domain-containing protein [Stellaceae bacterium]